MRLLGMRLIGVTVKLLEYVLQDLSDTVILLSVLESFEEGRKLVQNTVPNFYSIKGIKLKLIE